MRRHRNSQRRPGSTPGKAVTDVFQAQLQDLGDVVEAVVEAVVAEAPLAPAFHQPQAPQQPELV